MKEEEEKKRGDERRGVGSFCRREMRRKGEENRGSGMKGNALAVHGEG